MKINFAGQVDLSVADFIINKNKVQFTKEGEEALLIKMLLQSSKSALLCSNNVLIKTIDVDSDDNIQERKRYKYLFSKFLDCHPELKADTTFKTDSLECNSWYTKYDGVEVFPAIDEDGECFALIDGGFIYSFNRDWCEEFK